MAATPKDLYEILNKLRYDATSFQAKITDAINTLNALNLPEPKAGEHECPWDALIFTTEKRLAEHLWNVHGVDEVTKTNA